MTDSKSGPGDPHSPQELLDELRVHQTELEMQNQELREAQAQLETARERYVQLFELSPTGYLLLDADREIVQVNRTMARILQTTPAALRTDFFRRHVPAGMMGEVSKLLSTVFEDGRQHGCDCQLRSAEGDTVWVQLEGAPLELERGSPLCLLAVADVTEQQRARRQLEQFFELTPDPMCISAPDGRVLRASPSMVRLMGYSMDILGSRPFFEFIHPDDRALVRARLDLLASGLPTDRFQVRVETADGEYRTILWSCMPEIDQGLIYAVGHDVTEREASQSRLRRSQALLSSAQRIARMGSWEYDVPGDHLRWSDETYRTFGLVPGTPLEGLGGFLEMVHPEDRGALLASHQEADSEGSSVDVEYRIIRPDGEVRTVYERGEVARNAEGDVLRRLGMVMDITERRELEQQLRQSQKMESVGRLAGGIAHDFNNVLTVILGMIELKLGVMDPDDPDGEDLEEMRTAALRAARLTQQLLAFSRQQVVQVEVLDLNPVVTDMIQMLDRLVGDSVVLTVRPAEAPAWVRADRSQLEQILANLVVNARDAMPRGGQLTIQVDRVAGPAIRLRVEDDGCGMDPETMSRVFDPFFTTKALGDGTGLGLATVYGIVQQAGGEVSVESEPGEGSIFTVILPEAEAKAEVEAESEAESTKEVRGPASGVSASTPAAPGSLLVVEDEAALLRVARKVLERDGWEVLGASSAEEALQLLSRRPDDAGALRLVLTDLRLPGMTGLELVERLRADWPGLGVILTSGFGWGDVSEQLNDDARLHFLPKPYTVKALREAVSSTAIGAGP